MTIGNALSFMNRAIVDSALRERLNGASSTTELEGILTSEKLMFSDHDFDEAFRNRLTKCQEAEEADQLKELKLWWDLLRSLMAPSGCGKQCNGLCG